MPEAGLAGRVLADRYRVVELIGRGGMADVYRAWDLRRNQPVALKMLRPDIGEDREITARFRREAMSLDRLEHRNIVRSYGLESTSDGLFIVMDFIEGVSLRRRLYEANGPLRLDEAIWIIRQIASALDFAHHERIVHRDLKPSNILLTADGSALLSDFGVAKILDLGTSTETSGALPGTPAYMSPEQCAGRPLNHRSDLYSLAVVIFEMVSGRRPFVADGIGAGEGTVRERLCYQHRFVSAPSILVLNSALPMGIGAVLAKALSKEPGDRFESAIMLVEALERVAFEQGNVGGSAPPDFLGHIELVSDRISVVISGGLLTETVQLRCQAATVNALAFHPAGTLFAAGGTGGLIDLWDVSSGDHLMTARSPGDVTSLAFRPRAQLLASGDEDGRLSYWQVPREPISRVISATASERFDSGIVEVAYSPDTMVAVLPTQVLYGEGNLAASRCLATAEITAAVRACFDPCGQLLAVGSLLGDIWLLNASDWRLVHRLAGPMRPLADLAFSPSGDRLAVASGVDASVQIWDVSSAQIIKSLQTGESPALCVSFMPDGQSLVVGRADGTIFIWPLLEDGPERMLGRHPAAVTRLAVAPRSRWLFASSEDPNNTAMVRVWWLGEYHE